MPFSSADRRYEPFVPPLFPTVPRSGEVWPFERWQVHLERIGEPGAAVRLLLIHGAGGNAAAMWPFAAHLATLGARVTVPDLPGYGRTTGPEDVTYADWRRLLVMLARRERDGRPLVVMGASIGGLLAYETAAVAEVADRVIVTCLLDPTDPRAVAAMVRLPWLTRLLPALKIARGPLAAVPIPLRWLAAMNRISNDPGLNAAVLRDRHGGGGSMRLGWYRSFLEARPAVAPEKYIGPPVILLHPSEDRWTPTEISAAFLARIAGPTRLAELPGCGHFPIEQPGFAVLLDEVGRELRQLA